MQYQHQKKRKLSQEVIDIIVKKDCDSLGSGVLKQKVLISFNLQELHCDFKEKHPNVKVGFSKFVCIQNG